MSGWVGADARTLAAFTDAAHGFAELVAAIDPGTVDGGWDGAGLGVWDLRALVGHTSRALTTVTRYLEIPAEVEEIASTADYVAGSGAAPTSGQDEVAERGRQAGRDLGSDVVGAVERLARTAVTAVTAADPERLIHTIGGGMRVRTYLPSRTFELVVHGYDIADAAGLDADFGEAALDQAVAVAAQVAVRLGHGTDLLRGLTGRGPWPEGFVVVR